MFRHAGKEAIDQINQDRKGTDYIAGNHFYRWRRQEDAVSVGADQHEGLALFLIQRNVRNALGAGTRTPTRISTILPAMMQLWADAGQIRFAQHVHGIDKTQ